MRKLLAIIDAGSENEQVFEEVKRQALLEKIELVILNIDKSIISNAFDLYHMFDEVEEYNSDHLRNEKIKECLDLDVKIRHIEDCNVLWEYTIPKLVEEYRINEIVIAHSGNYNKAFNSQSIASQIVSLLHYIDCNVNVIKSKGDYVDHFHNKKQSFVI